MQNKLNIVSTEKYDDQSQFSPGEFVIVFVVG